ncbi:N-acetylglucosaminyl transferase component-domain-containing protein [Polychytrium aggregatum]|uniref:N-acetylglucosaminyl transferase component-domain-containing protein n=1 Tax=Polychytrium aggregatum TaxID=110093 RepID=UPI0022FDEA39|nr:N-acetylglucosaminyl transferase component-domain-containing protein [Polychytrium aggregatum]KAI9208847.1 N-acetylglucosaminyl transferase component-domain-containing protein [Polychytrium aggregatum]
MNLARPLPVARRIFWPESGLSTPRSRPSRGRSASVLVGWTVANDIHVVWKHSCGKSIRPDDLARLLQFIRTVDPTLDIVGVCADTLDSLDPSVEASPEWIYVSAESVLPVPLAHSESWQVVFYLPPKTTALRYLSRDTLEFDLCGSLVNPGKAGSTIREKLLRSISVPATACSHDEYLDGMNQTHSIQVQLSRYGSQPCLHLVLADHFFQTISSVWAWTVAKFTIPALYIIFAMRMFAEVSIFALNFDLLGLRKKPIEPADSDPSVLPSRQHVDDAGGEAEPAAVLSMANLFVSFRQLDLRLQQLCFWPYQYVCWKQSNRQLIHVGLAQYIGVYNTIWLVTNDMIIGFGVAVLVMENAGLIANWLVYLMETLALQSMRETIVWLMGAPAGLKLNSEMNGFIGNLFLFILDVWQALFEVFKPHLKTVIHTLAYGGYLGLSMIIGLFFDLVQIMTFHLHIFYLMSARLYHWQVNCMRSLFTLFRGKKKNILQNRYDSSDYGVDQLLIGTIFFTVLVFLFPTLASYYFAFSMPRVASVLLYSTVEIALAIINHFPLFALMLRVKDPQRLPSGIAFEIIDGDQVWFGSNEHTFLRVKSMPASLSTIFYEYQYLLKRVFSYYLSRNILKALLTGRRIQRIPKLQYPSLPPRSTMQLWSSVGFMEFLRAPGPPRSG